MINLAIEGASDEGAAKAVVRAAGHAVGKVAIARGKTKLDPKIPKYLAASRHTAWVVFRDSDGRCPVELRRLLLPPAGDGSATFALRIAHTMTEAWLMADAEGFADYFRVRRAAVPADPEALPHAKRSLLELCGGSRSREIRKDVVTDHIETGPLYVTRINEFATTRWDVAAAMANSPSLVRAVRAIRALTPTYGEAFEGN